MRFYLVFGGDCNFLPLQSNDDAIFDAFDHIVKRMKDAFRIRQCIFECLLFRKRHWTSIAETMHRLNEKLIDSSQCSFGWTAE